MSEPTQTDASAETPNTDEVEQEVSTPTEETVEAADKSTGTLNYDEILSRGKRNKETRGGLSRKELAEKKAEAKEELEEEEQPDRIEQLEKTIEELTNEIRATNNRKSEEQKFTEALSLKGVSIGEFNSTYKDEFLTELDDLLDAGVSPEKAREKALKMVLPKIQSEEESKRATVRGGIKLPPHSTATGDKTTYRLSELTAMSDAEYSRIMDLRKAGKVIVDESR